MNCRNTNFNRERLKKKILKWTMKNIQKLGFIGHQTIKHIEDILDFYEIYKREITTEEFNQILKIKLCDFCGNFRDINDFFDESQCMDCRKKELEGLQNIKYSK